MKRLAHAMKHIATKMENKVGMAVASSVAAGILPVTASATAEAKTKVTDIAGIVVDIFPLIGVFFIIAGGFKLIMAYRNDQPEAQTSAAKDIVIGVVLVVFRVFAWPTLRNAF